MKKTSYINVIDVPLYARAIPDFIDEVFDILHSEDKPRNYCVSATGAHGLIHAQKNPKFKKLLQNFYANLPDGMPGVWVGKLKGATDMERCYGPDVFEALIRKTASKEINHFLCGGTKGVAERLRTVCGEKYNNNRVVGTFCPPFLPVEEYAYEEIACNINQTQADIVWIGISTPKQEEFAQRLAEHTQVHLLITVGAAFDFHIGNVRQAPTWMQKIGMEWLFRLMMEPRRLYKRYMEIVPAFLYHSAIDLWNSKLKKRDI